MPLLTMHAVIKIISLLVFGAAITLGQGAILLAGALLVAALYLMGSVPLAHALQMLRRLRWLFLSILVVYVFFTPGQLVWASLPWGPTLQGLGQGGLRIAALVLLVMAVNWVIASTAQGDFLVAIVWCLRPLACFGLSPERLALRITLTLEWVTTVRHSYRQQAQGAASSGSRLATVVERAQQLVNEVMQRAQTEPLREISLPATSQPPWLQWLIPLCLAGLFGLLKVYGVPWAALLMT